MSAHVKTCFIIFSILGALAVARPSMANGFEDKLLKIIDKEVLRMAEDPNDFEWTDHGVQPKDGYELDYSEKCAFIAGAGTRNKKAIAACAWIVGTN